jgi:DNA-binding transcriptional MerR regulator
MIVDVPRDDDRQLIPIGEFARRSRLSARALRLYDERGLLSPASVDRFTGYRYYTEDQVGAARLTGLLRAAGMSLHDIGEVLVALGRSRAAAADLLDRYLAQLESTHRGRRLVVRHVHTLLQEDHHSMFTIDTRHVPSLRVMSIQRRLHGSETDAFVVEAKSAFAALLGPSAPTGPFTLIFHGLVDDDHDGPIEAILGCPAHTQPSDVVGVRTEPAHDEAFTTITKAQWEFPAILAAYDAVAGSPVAIARPGSPLSCREVYLAEPDDIGDQEPICDVAFPLGDGSPRDRL